MPSTGCNTIHCLNKFKAGSGPIPIQLKPGKVIPMHIHTTLINQSRPRDKHRKELKTKSGFTNETLNKVRLRSAVRKVLGNILAPLRRNTLIGWIISLLAFPKTKAMSPPRSIAKVFSPTLFVRNNRLIWFNECKNSTSKWKDETLKGIYDRKGYVRTGKCDDDKTTTLPIRSAAVITKKETSTSSGPYTGCLTIDLAEKGGNRPLYRCLVREASVSSAPAPQTIRADQKPRPLILKYCKKLEEIFGIRLIVHTLSPHMKMGLMRFKVMIMIGFCLEHIRKSGGGKPICCRKKFIITIIIIIGHRS